MRVVITGLVVSNGGDAAILDAQLDLVRRTWPTCSITIHDSAPEVARRLYPDLDVRPWLAAASRRPSSRRGRVLRRVDRARVAAAARVARHSPRLGEGLLQGRERPTLSSLFRADVVAHTGGTTLIEKYPLDDKLRELELARRAGAAVVMLPQSLGPFQDADHIARMRDVVASAELVLLRDERSRGHLEQLGGTTDTVHVVPDVVFALGYEDAADRLRSRTLPARPRVAISVRDCARFLDDPAGQSRYEAGVAGLVERLVRDHGARVLFVSTCQGIPEYRMDDSAVALRVAERLEASLRTDVHVDRRRHDHAELTKILGEQDVVVATRMHVGITALGAGTPVLPLAYEFKTREVMAQAGLGRHVQDVADVDAPSLVEGYERLVRELPAIRADVADAVAELRSSARSLDLLLAHVGSQP